MAFTLVTATVVDPNGIPYAFAKYSARLVSTSTPRVGANLIDAYANGNLDANGSFTVQLVDNATVTPAASTWTITIDNNGSAIPPPAGFGPVSFTVSGITITGAAQSLSATLTAAAPAQGRSPGTGTSGVVLSGTGTFGPSAGHATLDPNVGSAVLEAISNSLAVAPLALDNTALPGSSFAIFMAGGANSFFQMTDDGVNFTVIEFGTIGGTPALHFNVGATGKIGFFNSAPVARQTLAGGTGGNSALASLVAALGFTTGSGLILETALVNGQNIAVDGAINPIAGNVVITKAGVLAGTLAAPTTPAQDYTMLRIVSTTANAHVITGPAAGFNAGGAGADVATLTSAAIGDGIVLMAFGGVWYIVSARGTITLS